MATARLITQPDEAAKKLFHYLVANPDAFPKDIRDRMLQYLEPGNSIAFAVSEAAEMIFARQEDLSKEELSLGAELALCASYNNINNFADNEGERGRAIATALRRASGEKAPDGMSWPPKEEDPAPKDVYLAPKAPEPAEGDLKATDKSRLTSSKK